MTNIFHHAILGLEHGLESSCNTRSHLNTRTRYFLGHFKDHWMVPAPLSFGRSGGGTPHAFNHGDYCRKTPSWRIGIASIFWTVVVLADRSTASPCTWYLVLIKLSKARGTPYSASDACMFSAQIIAVTALLSRLLCTHSSLKRTKRSSCLVLMLIEHFRSCQTLSSRSQQDTRPPSP